MNIVEHIERTHELAQHLVKENQELKDHIAATAYQGKVDGGQAVLVGYMLVGTDGKPVKNRIYADEIQAEKAKAGVIRTSSHLSAKVYTVLPVYRPAMSFDNADPSVPQPTPVPPQPQGNYRGGMYKTKEEAEAAADAAIERARASMNNR